MYNIVNIAFIMLRCHIIGASLNEAHIRIHKKYMRVRVGLYSVESAKHKDSRLENMRIHESAEHKDSRLEHENTQECRTQR